MVSLGEFLHAGLGVGGDTGKTVGLDAEVVAVHGHVEEAVVAPVGTPGVATDPVLLASGGVLAVTNDGDLVVDHGEADVLRVDVVALSLGDANVFCLEFVSGMNTTRDGTVLEELGHHLVLAGDGVVLADVVLLVLDSGAVLHAGLALGGRRPGAVTADIDVSAHAVNQVEGGVLLARGVRDTGVVGILVDEGGVSTIARATSLAVDNSLGVETDGGGTEATVQDVESVSDGRGGALSPA